MGLPGLINFWSFSTDFLPFPGLWLAQQFPYICRQSTDRIGVKFGGPTHYGLPQAWLTFGHTPLNFCCFLASDFSICFCTFADNSWSDWAEVWWAKSLWAYLSLINFCSWSTAFLASDWSNSFCAFASHWWNWGQIWWANSLWAPQAWLIFGYTALNPSSDYPLLGFDPPAGDMHLLKPCYFINKMNTFLWLVSVKM